MFPIPSVSIKFSYSDPEFDNIEHWQSSSSQYEYFSLFIDGIICDN